MLMLKTVTVLEAISKRRRTARPAAHTGLSKNTIFAATHSAEDALVLLDATANGLTVEQALAARDAGRLTLPLKSHGWLYEVISNWRPQAGQVVATGEPRQALAKTPSKTLSAIAALEDRARG